MGSAAQTPEERLEAKLKSKAKVLKFFTDPGGLAKRLDRGLNADGSLKADSTPRQKRARAVTKDIGGYYQFYAPDPLVYTSWEECCWTVDLTPETGPRIIPWVDGKATHPPGALGACVLTFPEVEDLENLTEDPFGGMRLYKISKMLVTSVRRAVLIQQFLS